MKTPRLSKVQQIDFTANTMKARDLPKRALRALRLWLQIVHTNGASPTITWESFCKLINNLALTANGQDTIINIPFWFLYVLNYYDFSIAPYNSLDTTASSQVTSKIGVILPFELTRAVAPEDCILDARGLSTLVLDANFLNSIGTGITSIDSGFLGIDTDEYVNIPGGDKIGGARKEYSYISHSITASGEEANGINIPTGGLNEYRRIFIITRNSSGVMSDSIIDNIKIISGASTFLDQSASRIQGYNKSDFAIAPITGVYIYDLTRNGKMTERLNARQLSELFLKVNSLVSSGTVDVILEKAIYGG